MEFHSLQRNPNDKTRIILSVLVACKSPAGASHTTPSPPDYSAVLRFMLDTIRVVIT